MEGATIYAIVGEDGRNLEPDASLAWFEESPERQKEFLVALNDWVGQEKDRATLGRIGAVWDGRWIFWHRMVN